MNFDIAIFEIDANKNMVNLTKMCKSFDKRLDAWKELKSTKDFLDAMSEQVNTEIMVSLRGNKSDGSEQGTWGTREVALELAQWISPRFKVFCIQKLDELFQTGKTELQQSKFRLPTNEIEALEMLLDEKKANKLLLETTAALNEQIENDKPKIDYYDKVIDSKDSYDMIAAAALLKIDKGRNKLLADLRNKKYLMEDNVPYRQYIDLGYFRVVQKGSSAFTNKTISVTLVTQKGLVFLQKLYNNK